MNVEDCADGPLLGRGYNECVMESIDNLEQFIIAKHPSPIINYDYSYSKKNNVVYQEGSRAYSFEHNGVHFVQLNLHPDYRKSIAGTIQQQNYVYDITSAIPWLDKDLADATSRGMKIILNFHEPELDQSLLDKDKTLGNKTFPDDFKNILSKYKNNIVAIFAGHLHYQDYNPNYFSNIPLFVSDALFHGAYYKIDVASNGLTIEELNGKTGKATPTGKTYHVGWFVPSPPAPPHGGTNSPHCTGKMCD